MRWGSTTLSGFTSVYLTKPPDGPCPETRSMPSLSLKREVQGSHRIADVRMPETQRNQNTLIAMTANISGRPQHTAVHLTKMGER